MRIDFNSKSLQSSSFTPNDEVIVLQEDDTKFKQIVKGIVIVSAEPTDVAVVTLKLGKSIILSQNLQPGEYINLNSPIVVTSDTPLKFMTSSMNIDLSMLMIMKVEKVVL